MATTGTSSPMRYSPATKPAPAKPAPSTLEDAAKPAQAGKPEQSSTATSSGAAASVDPKPNARPFNPLSKYSSYTYQLSLYMITPDAYDAFTLSDRKVLNVLPQNSAGKGAYLIAQSGGINNTTSKRAPEFDFDYYIDSLKISAAISPQATGTSSATYDMSFNIIEPYGFSFVTNLKLASSAINQYCTTTNIKTITNPAKQFFILGVKFLGYDASGNIMPESQGTFQRYWDIAITEFNFKIDGRIVTYSIKAASLAIQSVMGLKRGVINQGAVAAGTTVRDLLEGNDQKNGKYGILTKLNDDERENKETVEKNTYRVEFIGPGAEDIANSKIASKADLDKLKMNMGNAKTKDEVNAILEEKSGVPNVNARQVSFKGATPTLQAIQQIISQSSYITDALNTVYTTAPQPNPKTDSPEVIKPDANKTVKWYNVSVRVSNPRVDKNRNDFVYDITYVIQAYSAPVILSSLVNNFPKYYGPVKRYDYWYTGQNSEVLKYEQTMNNLFFNVMTKAGITNEPYGGNANIPIVLDKYTSVQRLGKTGLGAQASNQVATQLLDRGAYATAKLEILGDPDWLVDPAPPNTADGYNPYYAKDGFTINPNAGQVFVEVDFKEAIDYNTSTGLMDINNNIMFWEYPKSIAKDIHGISYRVLVVNSVFSGGRFTQTLDLVINDFGYDPEKDDPNQRGNVTDENQTANETRRLNSANGSATTASGGTSQANGLKPVPTPPKKSTVAPAPIINPTIPTGSVHDDQTLVNTIGGP